MLSFDILISHRRRLYTCACCISPRESFYPYRKATVTLKSERSDRAPGNRGAYENARKKILATQTTCGICGKPVDFSYRAPHPLSPTVDHIVPVSKGGHPSDISNLQLAHRCCNREKSDKLFMDARRAMKSGEKGAQKGGIFDTATPVPNQLLEQHADWMSYRAAVGD